MRYLSCAQREMSQRGTAHFTYAMHKKFEGADPSH